MAGGITIPQGQVSPGEAAHVRLADTNRIGEAVARVGGQMLQAGHVLETDRLDRDMLRSRGEMVRGLGQARLDMREIGDPEAMETAWTARSAELRETLLTGADPQNRERLGYAFDELSDRHALSIAGDAQDRRFSQSRVLIDNQRDAILASAADLDAESHAANLDTLADSLAQGVERGIYTAEQANDFMKRATESAEQARVIRRFTDDPVGLAADLDAGKYAGLDPIYRENMRTRAAGEAERRAKIRADRTGDEMREFRDVLEAGAEVVDPGRLESEDWIASPEYPETMAAWELARERGAIGQMNLDQLDAAIAEEKARPKAYKWQTERVGVLEKARDARAEGQAKDPIGYAIETGSRVSELPEFDAADPRGFRQGLRDRVSDRDTLAARGLAEADAIPLTLEEQAALKEASAVDADPATRATLARELSGGLGIAAAESVSGDPVFAIMGSYLARGGSPALAQEAFRGQQAIEAKTVILPPAKDRLEPVFDQVGALFGDLPGGDAQEARIVQAADALYAARMRRSDPAGGIDEVVYSQALHDAMGGTGRFDGSDARGGVQEFRGALTMLPPGVRAAEVENQLGRLGTVSVERDRRSRRIVREDALDADLKAISPSGQAPEINGKPVTARDLSGYSLQATNVRGQYRFVRRGHVLTIADGTEYVFDMAALARVTAQGARR